MDALSATSAAAAAQQALTSPAAKKNLGAEDFLKLLTVQLQNQDPLEPMKDTDFIAQMANFSSLEQMRELAQGFGNFQEQQQRIAAQAYLGKEVTLGEATQGIVEAVSQADDGQLVVTIDGQDFPVADIRRVALPAEQAAEVTE